MIQLEKVYTGYGKQEILHGVDLEISKGKIVTVIGTNGSGKSTLLRVLLGLLPLWDGDIQIDGTSIKEMGRTEIARKIAYLSQGKNVPDITAGRMVLHGRFSYLRYPRKYRETDLRIAREAMKQMNIENLAEKQMAELSGGMRQKVYIAMALAQQAEVIVMDEPTAYLDIGQQMKFAQMMKSLAKDGKAIVLVLHDILLALQISDQIVAIQEGGVLRRGTPEEILESGIPEMLYNVAVRSCRTEACLQYYYEMSGF